MQITSKYQGKCSTCGGKIRKGETIDWSRSGGARHVACVSINPGSGGPQEDYPCSDRGYEDQCAAACGFGLAGERW